MLEAVDRKWIDCGDDLFSEMAVKGSSIQCLYMWIRTVGDEHDAVTVRWRKQVPGRGVGE